MKIHSIAGFATITAEPAASAALYQNTLGLPLQAHGEYRFMDNFAGAQHFGVWPLSMAAQSCFGQDTWPADVPTPTSSLEFELTHEAAVQEAVAEMKAQGQAFVHEARQEPWGQTLARFLSPEGVLIALCYSPWLHTAPASE